MMILNTDTTLDQFRDEMQHRVVKYPLNSRPVKEALRFAKKHEDAAFYRIASDKIHAQRQFQRELYGPSKLERVVDFVSLGSLREVVITLLLVAGGVVGLDVAKYVMRPDPDEDMYSQVDVEELATQLGLALEPSGPTETNGPADGGPLRQDESVEGETTPGDSTRHLSDADIARIAEAVIQRLTAQRESLDTANTTEADVRIPVSADEATSLAALSDETERN